MLRYVLPTPRTGVFLGGFAPPPLERFAGGALHKNHTSQNRQQGPVNISLRLILEYTHRRGCASVQPPRRFLAAIPSYPHHLLASPNSRRTIRNRNQVHACPEVVLLNKHTLHTRTLRHKDTSFVSNRSIYQRPVPECASGTVRSSLPEIRYNAQGAHTRKLRARQRPQHHRPLSLGMGP